MAFRCYNAIVHGARERPMIGDAALRVFDRNKDKVLRMMWTLNMQSGLFFQSEELMVEVQERWSFLFEKFYETDNQYLRFMFIVMKNRMKILKKQEMRYRSRNISDPKVINARFSIFLEEESSVRIWNEMAEDKREEKPVDCAIKNEIKERVCSGLKPLHAKIFLLLVDGYPVSEIAKQLGFSQGHVSNIRSKFIWPQVKEAMHISDEKYERLTDSGRVDSPEDYENSILEESDLLTQAINEKNQ